MVKGSPTNGGEAVLFVMSFTYCATKSMELVISFR